MATISKALLGILFNAASLTLASAPWKNNVRAIYGFNPAGNGYQLFKPGSNFNSLTELVKDGVYIVDAGTLGFDLPGAVVSMPVAISGPGSLSLSRFDVSSSMVMPGYRVDYLLRTTNLNVPFFPVLYYVENSGEPSGLTRVNQAGFINLGPLSPGSTQVVVFVDGIGNVLRKSFIVEELPNA